MNGKNIVRVALAIIAAILGVIQILDVDFNDFDWKDLSGPISMCLLIIAMLVSIRESKKNEK